MNMRRRIERLEAQRSKRSSAPTVAIVYLPDHEGGTAHREVWQLVNGYPVVKLPDNGRGYSPLQAPSGPESPYTLRLHRLEPSWKRGTLMVTSAHATMHR